ncbi:MAG: inorganic diphosphatase, partial [Candidatus Paceibacterota bacterium]
AGQKGPCKKCKTIIEIPKGSHNKYEIDKESGLIALDRANYSDAPYPADYGFVPQTYWHDDDALDVMVLSTYPIAVGVLVPVRPIGIMEMTDEGDNDAKIIGVPVKDRRWEDVQELKDINKHTLRTIRHFFETYKILKTGDGETETGITVHGFKEKSDAIKAIEEGLKLYNDKFTT